MDPDRYLAVRCSSVAGRVRILGRVVEQFPAGVEVKGKERWSELEGRVVRVGLYPME